MSNPIYPFTVLRYTLNPSIWQVGQAVSVGPSPGAAQATYAITSGTLPAGLSLSSSTGIISGTPTTVTPASTILITATLTDASTKQCSVIITISDIPVIAPAANQTSATDLTALMNQAAINFITDATAMIVNNNQLGLFQAFFDLLDYAPINALRTYFQNLGYTFNIVTQENWQYQYNSPYLGEFYYIGYPYYQNGPLNPFGPVPALNYPYSGPQQTPVRPRVLITWQSTPVCPQWPYYPFGT